MEIPKILPKKKYKKVLQKLKKSVIISKANTMDGFSRCTVFHGLVEVFGY